MGIGLAAPVKRLAAGVPDRVDPPGVRENLKVPVDGSEADALAAAAQFGIDLLRAAESRQPVKHGGDRLGLPGPAYPAAARGATWDALGGAHSRTVAAGPDPAIGVICPPGASGARETVGA